MRALSRAMAVSAAMRRRSSHAPERGRHQEHDDGVGEPLGEPGWCRARANDTKTAAPTHGTSGSRTSAGSRPVHALRRPGRPAPGRRRRHTSRQIAELCAERGHHREKGHQGKQRGTHRVPRRNARTAPTGRENTPVAGPGQCHRFEHPLSVEVFGRSSDRALTVPEIRP